MSLSMIGCVAVGIALAMVVLFSLAGGLAPAWSASGLGQTLLGAMSALTGIVGGQIAHRRFFGAK